MLRRTLCLAAFVAWHVAPVSAQPLVVSDFPPADHSIVITLDRDGGRALVDALQHQAPRARRSKSSCATVTSTKRSGCSLASSTQTTLSSCPGSRPRIQRRDGRTIRSAAPAQHRLAGIWTHHSGHPPAPARRGRGYGHARSCGFKPTWLPEARAETWAENLRAFVATYDGTAAARFAAEVESADGEPAARPETSSIFERYAREHDGTLAGAHALYREPRFNWESDSAVTGIEPRGSDPTDRLLRVVTLARRVSWKAGRYPRASGCAGADTRQRVLRVRFASAVLRTRQCAATLARRVWRLRPSAPGVA